MGFVVFVICAIFFVLGVICTCVGNVASKAIGGMVMVASIISAIVIPFSIHTVDTGEIAVVKHLGEAVGVRTAGTHYDFWMTNSYQYYDSKVQDVHIETAAYSSDAQPMDVSISLQYQIMGDRAMDIAKQYGSLDILQSRIESISTEKAKSVLSMHKAMDIIAERSSMSPAVEEAIKNAVGEEFYVNVTAVVLTNIDFSDAFESAVEDKMIAEQKQLQAQYENQTKINATQAQADSLLISSQAEADALLISAQAQADANRIINESITDKILAEKYYETWNGVLPNVVSGDSVSMIIPDTYMGN